MAKFERAYKSMRQFWEQLGQPDQGCPLNGNVNG